MPSRRTPASALLAFAALLVAPLPALGQTEVERRVDAKPDATVEIENISGSVVVRGADASEVRVLAILGRGVDELHVESSGSRVEIEVEYTRSSGGYRGGADLEIWVPRGASVDIETVSAEITVDGVNGEVRAESVSGSIEVGGKPSGILAETVSGSIEVDAETPDVQLESVSGSIDVQGVRREIDAETVSGRVRVRGERLEQVRLGAVSGRIELDATLAPKADVDIESHSGSVEILVPEDVGASWNVTTFSGRIRNDIGPAPRKVGRYTPESELRFKSGDGGARIRIESFSGPVEIRRR